MNLNSEQSDIDLGIDVSHENNKSTGLQRTPEWFEQRRGQYNASEGKTLMTCSPKYAKASWHNPDKYLAFSDGSLKYIFKKAKERQTGRIIETTSTNQMKYGTAIEDLIFRRGNEMLKEKGFYLEKVGYKTFDDIPTAGASSDAIVKRISDNQIIASGEMKACVSWETLFERTFEATDEKSIDFWQTLQQMLAWNVEQSYYFVASPPSDIKKYIYSDDIESMYEEWCNETELHIEIIERSEIHAANLKKRMMIAEETIQRYLETNENIRNLLYEVIEEFRNNQVVTEDEKSEFELQQEKEKELTTEEIFDSVITEDEIPVLEKEPEKEIQSIEDIDDLPF